MKKITATISLILAVLVLASCSATVGINVKQDGTVIGSYEIKLTQDEYNLGKSNGTIEASGFNFKETTIDETVYYIAEYSQISTEQDLKDLFNEDTGDFVCGKLTTTDFWCKIGKASETMESYIMLGAEINYSVTLPYEIVKTNATLSEDKYTITFKAFDFGKVYYATTDKSTATWTKAEDVGATITSYANLFIRHPNIKATLVSKKTAKITWNTKNNAQKYEVYRKVVGGQWKLLKTTKNLTYNDTTIKTGKVYYYKVRGLNDKWTSRCSAVKSVKSIAGKTKINKIGVSGKKIVVKINQVKYATGYQVLIAKSKRGTYKSLGYTTKTKFTTTKLKTGVYYVKVRAYQKYGKTKWCNQLSNYKKAIVK